MAPPIGKRYQGKADGATTENYLGMERAQNSLISSSKMDMFHRPTSKQTLQQLNKVFTSAIPRPQLTQSSFQNQNWRSSSYYKPAGKRDQSSSPRGQASRDPYWSRAKANSILKPNDMGRQRATVQGVKETAIYKELKTHLPLKPQFTIKGDIIYNKRSPAPIMKAKKKIA